MKSDECGIDGGPEVVHVRDHHGFAAALDEFSEQGAIAKSVGQIAVARGVEARLSVVLEEQVAVGGQPQGQLLGEQSQSFAIHTLVEGVGERSIRRERRHEPERDGFARDVREVIDLGQTEIEKALLGDCFDQCLHDSAHARRHASCEDDQRALTATKRSHSGVAQLRPFFGVTTRQLE